MSEGRLTRSRKTRFARRFSDSRSGGGALLARSAARRTGSSGSDVSPVGYSWVSAPQDSASLNRRSAVRSSSTDPRRVETEDDSVRRQRQRPYKIKITKHTK